MGILCKMFDHQNDAINFWGEECEYILFRCKRCKHEEIYCSYEGKTLPNDKLGHKIMKKMIEDKDFSDACHIHNLFVMAEFNNAFNFKKQKEEYKKIQDKFNLPSDKRPACPVEMYKAGLWIDKEPKSNSKSEPAKKPKPVPKPESKSKPKGRTGPINLSNPAPTEGEKSIEPVGENSYFQFKDHYTNEVEPVNYDFQKSVKVPIGGETLEQLKRLEKIYVENENYEKAAEIHSKIQKLKK